jgi:hypothetical protein
VDNLFYELGESQSKQNQPESEAASAQQKFLAEVQHAREPVEAPGTRATHDVTIALPTDWAILSRLSKRLDLKISCKQAADDDLKQISGMQNVVFLDLDRTAVTDAGLKHIEGVSRLNYLNLRLTDCGDAGMKSVAKLANLKELHLVSTGVTEKGLLELKGLKKLETLSIGDTAVSDAAIKAIKDLPSLRSLSLYGTVSAAGLTDLKTNLSLKEIGLKQPGLSPEELEKVSKQLWDVEIWTTDGVSIDCYKNGARISHDLNDGNESASLGAKAHILRLGV